MRERGLAVRWEVVAVVLITMLAAALRFYRLPELPPGLHFDEAFKGFTARTLLEGAPLQLFFERDMGEEPLAMYLVAAALGILGQDPWIIRVPSAVVGTLTVPLVWWLGRELCRFAANGPKTEQTQDRPPPPSAIFEGQVVGLGSALVLAVLYWHLSFSRLGLEPILVPFFACLTFVALVRGLNTSRWPPFVVSGLALGASLYTYKAGYFVPIVAALFVGYAAVVGRGFLRCYRRPLLVAAVAACLVAAPIVLYFATHPANFWQRPASVALASGDGALASIWDALSQNVTPVLSMFFVEGDTNPRSNLPGRPALDPLLALLFLLGLARSVAQFRNPARMLPVIWLAVMAVPTLVTEHAPHFGRAIGATPALALLCALGGWSLWQAAVRWGPRWTRSAAIVLLAAGLLFSAVSTARAYFQRWADSPDLFHAFDVGLVQIADLIDDLPADEDLYLTPTDDEHFTLQYLVRRPFSTFDGRQGLPLPAPGRAATIVILLQEDEMTEAYLQQVAPDSTRLWDLTDERDEPYAAAHRLPASMDDRAPVLWNTSDGPFGTVGHDTDMIFGNTVRLLGYSLSDDAVVPDETLRVTLYWQALEPLDRNYTVFTHLLGEYNQATGGAVWAGHDGQPDGGHYPTSEWQPGQIVIDIHTLELPPTSPRGDYQLEAGLYLLETLARLPAANHAGGPLPDDAALLGTVTVPGESHEP